MCAFDSHIFVIPDGFSISMQNQQEVEITKQFCIIACAVPFIVKTKKKSAVAIFAEDGPRHSINTHNVEKGFRNISSQRHHCPIQPNCKKRTWTWDDLNNLHGFTNNAKHKQTIINICEVSQFMWNNVCKKNAEHVKNVNHCMISTWKLRWISVSAQTEACKLKWRQILLSITATPPKEPAVAIYASSDRRLLLHLDWSSNAVLSEHESLA